jgi:hypothetical protein
MLSQPSGFDFGDSPRSKLLDAGRVSIFHPGRIFMGLVNLVLLVLLGILGIASWLKSRQPNLAAQLGKLEAVEGWIGLVGLVWGIVMLLQWLQVLSVLSYAPIRALIGLASVLVVIALSLILGLPQLRSLIGSSAFTNKLAELAGKLGPYKMVLGCACLFLAASTLLSMAGVRTL